MTVTNETRADQLKRLLEEEIVACELAPGTRLDESRLAARFNVSRTPVREALRQLSDSGLVVLKPRVGAVVSAPTLPELLHMFESMAILESACGRLAARRMLPAELTALQERHAAMRTLIEACDNVGYHRENLPFHQAVYRGSHNPWLCRQAVALHRRLAPYRAFQLHQNGRLESSYAEHGAIVEALAAKDEEAAGQLLTRHVELQGAAIGDLISRIANFETKETG